MKRASQRGYSDLNTTAAGVVAEATGTAPPEPKKNPHAVALGRLGGEARKRQLSAERRKEIAIQARRARQVRYRARLRDAQAKEAAETG